VGLTTGERGGGLRAIRDSVGLEFIQEIAPRLAPAVAEPS
jgi:hypothetical protein